VGDDVFADLVRPSSKVAAGEAIDIVPATLPLVSPIEQSVWWPIQTMKPFGNGSVGSITK